jgi:hypothetical protein
MGSMGGSSGGMSGSSGGMGSMGGSSGGMSGSSGGMGGASGWPQDPDQVLNESMGDFDGTIAGEREVLAKSGGGEAKSAGGREQRDSESVKDAGMGQGPGGMADASGGESASGGAAGAAAGGSAGGQSGDTAGSQPAGSQGSQAGGGSGSTSTQRSGRDSDASDRDGANVAIIPDDIPIDGSGEDRVAEQIREAAMQEEDPAIRDALWEEYRKHTGIR